MAFQYSAEDLGFVVDQEKVNCDETVSVDGFSFPKYLPNPIFKEEGELYYTSDQVEDSEMIRSVLPSFKTDNHCIVVPTSHIPPISDLLGENEQDEDFLSSSLKTVKRDLNVHMQEKAHSSLSEEQKEELNLQIGDCYTKITQIQIALMKLEKEKSNHINALYINEIVNFVKYLQSLCNSTLGFSREEIIADVAEMTRILDEYIVDTSHSDFQIRTYYHSLLSKYKI